MAKKKDTQSYEEMYIRLNADFQNYKRRVAQEQATWERDAQADVLRSLLGVMDDLQRAVESYAENKEVAQGLGIVLKNVVRVFTDLGVEEIDCSGAFDPELHEALMQVESDTHESGQIIEVLNKGYMFNSEVLRHAKVSVAK